MQEFFLLVLAAGLIVSLRLQRGRSVGIRRESSECPRIPTLDGWRGIAIAFVVFAHSWVWLGFGTDKLARWVHYPGIGIHIERAGRTGVGIFFCISGFLITSRLILHGVQLQSFYLRRVFRILPPVLVYLAVAGMFGVLGFLPIGRREVVASLFFYRNYFDANAWFTGHFWSLSIEEQFYLVWPFILATAGLKRSRVLAAISIFGLVVWRQMHWPLQDFACFHTDMCLDGILCGSVMALYWPQWKPFIHAMPRMVLPAALLAFFAVDLWSAELRGYAGLIQAMLVCLLMAGTITNPGLFASRILDSAAFTWVGRMSYSIYLWQQFFLCPAGTAHWQFPFRIIALGGAAWLSYHLVELPLQAAGRRLLQQAQSKLRVDNRRTLAAHA